MQVLLESRDAAKREVLGENLIADAVERVEAAEALFRILLLLLAVRRLLAGNRLVIGLLPVEKEFADLLPAFV